MSSNITKELNIFWAALRINIVQDVLEMSEESDVDDTYILWEPLKKSKGD